MSRNLGGRDGSSATDLPPLTISKTDDPVVVQEAQRDDYALHVTPGTWRLGRGQMAMAWSALLAAMFWIVIAATAAIAVGTTQAIIGLVAAALVHGVINIYLSRAASRSGLTVSLFSRALFGYHGASIATIVFAITATWFAVFEGSVLATAFQAQFGGSIVLWYLVVTLYAVPLVLGGVRVWLEKLNAFLLPIYAAGLIAAVIWATVDYGYSDEWLKYEPLVKAATAGPGWLYVFAIFMGVFSQMIYTFDFARMGKVKDQKFNGIVVFGPVFYFFTYIVNGVLGIYLSQVIPVEGGVSETSVVVGIVQLMGIWGLIFIFATQTKIQTANLYLASTNFQSFFSRALRINLPRSAWVLFVGVVMFVMMYLDAFAFILQWLSYQGAVIVAWVAVALVHIAYERRQKNAANKIEFRPGRIPDINPGGIGSWFIGSVIGVGLLATKTAFGGTWALIITFVVAGGLYALSLEKAKKSWFVLARPNDPHHEVDDVWEDRVKCAHCEKSYIAVEMDRDPGTGHEPICSACATGHEFRKHAREDSRAYISARQGGHAGSRQRSSHDTSA